MTLNVFKVQGCALREGRREPRLWTCKISGAQHMICMKKVRFSSRPGAKVRHQGLLGSARAQPWSFCQLFLFPRFSQFFLFHVISKQLLCHLHRLFVFCKSLSSNFFFYVLLSKRSKPACHVFAYSLMARNTKGANLTWLTLEVMHCSHTWHDYPWSWASMTWLLYNLLVDDVPGADFKNSR